MRKEFQKSALPTLFHFLRVRAAFQPHVDWILVDLLHKNFAQTTQGPMGRVAQRSLKPKSASKFRIYMIKWSYHCFLSHQFTDFVELDEELKKCKIETFFCSAIKLFFGTLFIDIT